MVWTPELLTHRFNLDHPLDPVRLDLTMRLARELGVLEGVDLLEPCLLYTSPSPRDRS